jgi:tripartite-type tricarboxylate transporter receptor subunit TctC
MRAAVSSTSIEGAGQKPAPERFREEALRRALSIALLFGLAWAVPAQAQTYPARPIKMMIPLASGSAVDVAARIIAEKMGDILGQRFVIENEPGASGLIGTRAGARALPDGYTVLVLNDGVITMLPNMRSDAGYDPFKDFIPVTRLVGIEWVLVANPAFPAKTVAELVALAKEKPGGINFGSGGYGSPQHIAAEMFMRATNVQMTHVPYRGPTPAINDLVAGHVSVMFTALSTVTSLLPDGRLRVLASTTPKRLPQLGGAVSTMAESGVPGFAFATWAALMMPLKTPPQIVAKLNAAALATLKDPAVHDRLVELGFDVGGGTPEELTAYMRQEYTRTGDLIRAANIHE